MHRCLDVPELVLKICLQCDNHSLATLGRTARLFDCALDTLWSGRHIPQQEIYIQDLVECFPSKIRTRSADGCPVLLSSIEPQHWDRFHSYAQRVRAFYLSPRSIDPGFFAYLASNATPGGLLPNLTSFELNAEHEEELRYAHAFISPKLQKVFICCNPFFMRKPPSLSIVSPLLNPLPIVCKGITRLCLAIHGAVINLFVAALLGGLPNLHWLKIVGVSTEHFPLIVALPKLTHLALHNIMDGPVSLPVSAPACYALTSVDLISSPKHILALFGLLPRCPLETMVISLCSLRDGDAFGDVVQMVTSKCQTRSLRDVRISRDIFEHSSYIINTMGIHISPFLEFPNIISLDFRFFHFLFLDDTFISALATSFPNLNSLHLPKCYSETDQLPDKPTPTAKSLAFLAFHCRKLHTCHMEFDATSTSLSLLEDVGKDQDGTPIQLSIQDACNPSLQFLDVGCSPIADPELMAEYLQSLFPNIVSISFYASFDMGIEAREVYLDCWRRVASLLGAKVAHDL